MSDSEEEYVQKPAPRGRKTPKRPTAKSSARVASGKSAADDSGDSGKENIRERLEAFYGSNESDLVEAIRLRASFGNVVVSLLPEQLEPLQAVAPTEVNPDALSPVDSVSPLGRSHGGHDCVVDERMLHPQQLESDGVSTILNAGFCVTSIDWADNLLAVALVASEERPIDMSSLRDFRGDHPLVHIYDTSAGEPKLVASISGAVAAGAGGAPLVVKWRPGSRDLAVLLGDGSVCLVRVKDGEQIVRFRSLSARVPGEASRIAWRTPQCLVVGFSEGWLAEFDVSDEDFAAPSYVVKAHSSLVSALTTGWPNNVHSVFSAAVDGWSAVHDVRDLRRTQRPPRMRFLSSFCAYSPLVQSFVSLEDAATTALVLLRQPAQSHWPSILTRHSAAVTAVATCGQHPLVASGAQDGTLNVSNALLRTMVTRRAKEVMRDVGLWQLECSHKAGAYRFTTVNEAKEMKHQRPPNTLFVYPPSVSITDIKWQGTWIVSATAAGLIRFDNISA